MGRGLSPLQTWVLRRAVQQSRVYYAEVLVGFFGFKPDRPLTYHDDHDNALGRTLDMPGNQRFRPAAIGRDKYRCAVSALSRTCARLEARGLVTCLVAAGSHWAAVAITDAGRAWAAAHPGPAG
jgi:hypothetical protein